MRELKFRVYGGFIEKEFKAYDNVSIQMQGGELKIKPYDWRGNGDDVVIDQYTGLKDKNGKEIYEGDILGGIYEHGYIAYCDKCKQLQFFDADMGCMMCSGDIYWRDIVESERGGELEVVGNIHDNPELLGGEE